MRKDFVRSVACSDDFPTVPSGEEISFVLQILDQIVSPLLNNIEELLIDTSAWDDVARNDFCRFVNRKCRDILAASTPLA